MASASSQFAYQTYNELQFIFFPPFPCQPRKRRQGSRRQRRERKREARRKRRGSSLPPKEKRPASLDVFFIFSPIAMPSFALRMHENQDRSGQAFRTAAVPP